MSKQKENLVYVYVSKFSIQVFPYRTLEIVAFLCNFQQKSYESVSV